MENDTDRTARHLDIISRLRDSIRNGEKIEVNHELRERAIEEARPHITPPKERRRRTDEWYTAA